MDKNILGCPINITKSVNDRSSNKHKILEENPSKNHTSKENITTSISKDNITTSISKDNITTSISKDNITTSISKDNITTSISKDNITSIPPFRKENHKKCLNKSLKHEFIEKQT